MNENDIFILKRMLKGFMPEITLDRAQAYLADQLKLGRSLADSGDEAGGVLAGTRGAAVAIARGVSLEEAAGAFNRLIPDPTESYVEKIAKRYASALWLEECQQKAERVLRGEIMEALEIEKRLHARGLSTAVIGESLVKSGAVEAGVVESAYVKTLGYYSSSAFTTCDTPEAAQALISDIEEMAQTAGKFSAISTMLTCLTLWVNWGDIPVEVLESVSADLDEIGLPTNTPSDPLQRRAISGIQNLVGDAIQEINPTGTEDPMEVVAKIREVLVAKLRELGIEATDVGTGVSLDNRDLIERLSALGGTASGETEEQEDDVFADFLKGLSGDTDQTE